MQVASWVNEFPTCIKEGLPASLGKPEEASSGYVKFPLSAKIFQLFASLSRAEDDKNYEAIIATAKEILTKHCQDLGLDNEKIPQEFVTVFESTRPVGDSSEASNSKLNWEGILLKLHQAAYHTGYSKLANRIANPRVGSSENGSLKKTKSSETKEEESADTVPKSLLKENAQFIPIKAKSDPLTATSSMPVQPQHDRDKDRDSLSSSTQKISPMDPAADPLSFSRGGSLGSMGSYGSAGSGPKPNSFPDDLALKIAAEKEKAMGDGSKLSTSGSFSKSPGVKNFSPMLHPFSVIPPAVETEPNINLSGKTENRASKLKVEIQTDLPKIDPKKNAPPPSPKSSKTMAPGSRSGSGVFTNTFGSMGSTPGGTVFSFSEDDFLDSQKESFGSSKAVLPPSRLTESLSARSNLGRSFTFQKSPTVDALKQSLEVEESDEEEPTSVEAPYPDSMTVVAPPSYFRRKGSVFADAPASPVSFIQERALPDWMDFVLYWGELPNDSKSVPGLHVQLELVLLTLSSIGHYDLAFESLISHLLHTAVKSQLEKSGSDPTLTPLLEKYIQSYKPLFDESTSLNYLRNEYKNLRKFRLSSSRYKQYMEDLVAAFKTPTKLEPVLQKLEVELLLHTLANHRPSLQSMERLLISLLGDERPECRETAVRLLNILYDGHDWQKEEALVPVIRVIGDSFVVEGDVGNLTVELSNVWLLVYSPSLRLNSPEYVLSKYPVELKGTKLVARRLPPFKRAGYYDWRFVTIDSEGKCAPLAKKGSPLSQVQGRVIVHPRIRDEIMHEVWVELQDAEWDRNSGIIHKRGTIASVINALPEYKKFNITTLYIMGVLDRQNYSRPLTPVDRASVNKWLGDKAEFEELVFRAKKMGIKIVVDSTSRIAAQSAHRKYRHLICNTIDKNEWLRPHPGTDGKDFEWGDCVLLNYRKKETWDLMVSEIMAWASRGVNGTRLDSAHSWPLILRPNMHQLLREDSDGELHYTLQEIMDGNIVFPWTDEATTFGYYGTEKAKTYPNPFFIKMTQEIWRRYPDFMFLAEIYWGRELNAIQSGLVPYTSGLPRSLASIFNLGIHKDGSISRLAEKKDARVFYDWYQAEREKYPQGAILINPSSSHHIQYPSSIYGYGAWAAVDLLFFLPEVPMTYVGEHQGWMMNADITQNKFIDAGIIRSSLNLSAIKGHYEHRSALRKNLSALREGGMIPLFAYYSPQRWHDRVFTFARFTKTDIESDTESNPELAIVAININEASSIFFIDCSRLKNFVRESGKIMFKITDLINPHFNPQYYSPEEFLYDINFVQLPAYTSLCWGVQIQTISPSAERLLYEQSMARLDRNLHNNVDPSHNMIYALFNQGLESLDSFSSALKTISTKSTLSMEEKFPKYLQHLLFHTSANNEAKETQAIAYLTELAEKCTDPEIKKICQGALNYNILGPVVFITPEIGRFSTVGGIGVMVNELTQALAQIGCNVYIISPYYNYNRKGKTGYLKEEGIDYVDNIRTHVGPELCEVGIHYGKEHGVHLYFLHHYKYFSTPYNMGSALHQLQTIVLMAKASLELLCQKRILPAVVVTNDWFTALVPAYAKKSGDFGTTFAGTTFFHLVHNLEEGYEGKIYPDSDLSYIHHLPREIFNDFSSDDPCLNSSKCALLSCDQWGTVSISYRNDLMRVSPLAHLLRRFPSPFAILNGVRKEERLALLAKVAPSHESAKAALQKKYFDKVDPSIPVFSFVGRIVLQKGVHLILNALYDLIERSKGRIQIVIGGMANTKDPYAAQCAWSMQGLRREYPNQFWADPNEFFTDGPLLNLGSDFALMPSLFEPSGVVQQEYFVGGTPVIAFKTGGLKDSIFEFDPIAKTGNGFTFEAHAHHDFVQAVQRALAVYHNAEDYTKLRQNAFASVWDVANVARGWLKEYSRLRKVFWADPDAVAKYRKEKCSSKETAPSPKESATNNAAKEEATKDSNNVKK